MARVSGSVTSQIHGFLREVWINRLRSAIHGSRRSMDCADPQIALNIDNVSCTNSVIHELLCTVFWVIMRWGPKLYYICHICPFHPKLVSTFVSNQDS